MAQTFASPFTSSSLWNTPIDNLNVIYSDPKSAEDVQLRDTSLANTWAKFDHFVYTTPPSAPLVTWTFNVLNQTPVGGSFSSNSTIRLQTPTDLSFGNGSDGWAIFSDPDGIHYWEVWEGAYNAATMSYQAKYMVEGDYVNGTGWGQNGLGAGIRAAGASLLGGIVTQNELDHLSIQHALSIELDQTQLKAGTTPSDQFVFPAVSTDSGSQGAYTGTIPMGAHFALPANLDLLHAGLTPEGLALAEAYQTYGGYVVDSAGHTTSLAQVEGGTSQQRNDVFADLSWIREHLVMISTPDTVSPAPITIEAFGSTSLLQTANNFLLETSNGPGLLLKYSGAAVVAGQFGGWVPIGAEQTSRGFEVAWKIAGSDQYSIWNTDSTGNFTSIVIGPASGHSSAFESYEASFHQDLNGDGKIGAPTVPTIIEGFGSASLLQTGSNFYLDSGNGTGTLLKYSGSAVLDGQFGAWAPIGAEQTSSGFEVAWKMTGSAQYSIWNTDSSGNFTSLQIGPVSGTNAGLKSYEASFHQDLNGDGTISSPSTPTVLEAIGSTSLLQIANNFYLNSGGQSGILLKYSNAAVVAGQFGSWVPIGTEQTAAGYEVAWKTTGSDQYSIWNADSGGNFTSLLIGPVSGHSPAFESYEQIFHQDLNGDGHIGAAQIANGFLLS